ncbi:BQ5605_C031g10890 [Microbotryum silenes-dioicae]|uniref:BQ5605_C031g10890 protein n=1 Tax=Microbotryum silenes-dioicae TaxID=796604 RepID=A0A2X0PIF9_9BASI|nr:BQ5605_C031g10890 [Microbotryum silenes-dioicae]
MSDQAPPDPGRGPPEPAATGQPRALYQEKRDEEKKRKEDVARILKMISVEDGTRQGTRILVLKEALGFGKDRATSLRFSALNATKPIADTSGAVLEVTFEHTGVATEREKSELYSKKYAPVIHGVAPESIIQNGNTRFKFVVRCASAAALDQVHDAATKIEWKRSFAQVRKRLAFVKNVVELRFIISPEAEYTSDDLWSKLQGVVAKLTGDGHKCDLLQLQQPLTVVQGSYLVARGNYAAIVQFDDDDLFKNNGAQLRQVLPTRIDLRGRLATLTPLRHDYEAEASCRRCGFVGHSDNCVQKPVQRQQAAQKNNNNQRPQAEPQSSIEQTSTPQKQRRGDVASPSPPMSPVASKRSKKNASPTRATNNSPRVYPARSQSSTPTASALCGFIVAANPFASLAGDVAEEAQGEPAQALEDDEDAMSVVEAQLEPQQEVPPLEPSDLSDLQDRGAEGNQEEHTETSDAEEGESQSAETGSMPEVVSTTPELTRFRSASHHQLDMDGLPDDWMNRVSDRERKQDAGLYDEITELDRTPSVTGWMPSPSPGPVCDPEPEPKQEVEEGTSQGLRRSERIQRLTSVARTSDWNESTAADPLPSPTFGPMLSIKGAAAATKARSGFNTPERRRLLLSYLTSLTPPPSAILLQEHNVPKARQSHIRHEYAQSHQGEAYFSQHCLTLIPSSSPLLGGHRRTRQSLGGRLLVTTFDVRGSTDVVELNNIYAPVQPAERLLFFTSLHFRATVSSHIRFIAGDLNDCPIPAVDRAQQVDRPNTHHWPVLMSRLDGAYTDAIRLMHPLSPATTRPHLSKDGQLISRARIDFVLVQRRHERRIVSASTLYNISRPMSDHRPVMVTFRLRASGAEVEEELCLPQAAHFLTRINSSTFKHAEFKEFVTPLLEQAPSGDPVADLQRVLSESRVQALELSRRLFRERNALEMMLVSRLQDIESRRVLSPFDIIDWTNTHDALSKLVNERARQSRIRAHVPEIASEERLSRPVHAKLAARSRDVKFQSIRLADGELTTDMERTLEHTHSHFQQHYLVEAKDPEQVVTMRDELLGPIRSARPCDDPLSDARFLRRFSNSHVDILAEPISEAEVLAAIRTTHEGRSPGPSGVPYEMYRACPLLWAPLLTRAYNELITRGSLTPQQSQANVRLLFKHNKPGAARCDLKSYRPITLRECDYKIFTKVYVARLNRILPDVLPAGQHGFVKGRRPADAALHLRLLIDEIRGRGAEFPTAALLSLDQSSAYDMVEHDWVFAVFEALGAPEPFQRVLRMLYNGETSTARYIVNGFLTETVRLLCGLGQGDPLSSSVWDVVFQPFLDSLSRRNIALTITLPELAHRPQTRCITNLAFADDAVVAVAGPEAIASLEALARDWRLATNGRLNTDKTVVMPLGATLWDRADLSKLSFVAPDESLPWIGLQFAPDGNNRLGFHDLERRVDRVILSVRDRWMTHHTRAFYLNRYGISKVLHSLSADIPPSDVIKSIERKLADFVKGGPRRSDYKQSVVFTARARGGLSVVSIQDVVDSVSVRIWDVLAGGSTAIWGDLARSSIRRALPTFDFAADLWTWRNADAPRELHPRWRAVLSVAERYPAVVDPAKLSVSNLLSLSPLQPGLHDSRAFSEQDKRLAKHFSFERTIADIYARAQYPAAPTVPWTPEKHPQGDGSELSNLWQWKRDQVQAWIQVAGDRFIPPLPPPVPVLARRPPVIRVVGAPGARAGGPLEHILPRATPVGMPDQRLPLPSAPLLANQWRMLSLDRPYTIARLRRVINHRRFDDTQRPGSLATPKERRLFWGWFHTGPATAREREVHFKLAYHFTPTRKRQFVQRHGDSACCLVQACSLAGVEDDFTHFWHDCPDSSQFWQAARSIICDALGVVSILDLDYTALQIEHGLPRLRARLPTSKKRPIRAFIALALDTLSNRRWDLHRHARAMSSMDKEMAGLKERLELRLAR